MVILAYLTRLKIWIVFLPNFKPVRLSGPAKNDLQAIARYTAKQWGASHKKNYLDLIKKSFNTLSTQGNFGRQCDEVAVGLFVYTIRKHSVYFRETEKEIQIIRLLDSRMDVHQHLHE